jgi:transcriptional regulator with XRE-family HTH domain
MKTKKSKNRLGEMFRYYIACDNRTLRELAGEIGISAATLMRISHGLEPDSATLIKILNWMFMKV